MDGLTEAARSNKGLGMATAAQGHKSSHTGARTGDILGPGPGQTGARTRPYRGQAYVNIMV